jgi:7-cyano-7-deazaguanine reductase
MKVLGASVRHPVEHIEPIPLGDGHKLQTVTFKVTEFTSACPVTGQPDYYDILITIEPDGLSIESKSLKLWLWQYRDRGIFCEMLAQEVLDEVLEIVAPLRASVTVAQTSRGGIEVTATTRTKT